MATGLLPLLGALSDATTTPSVNPLYGAHYLTTNDHPDIPNAGWYDVNGNDVSDQMAKIPKEHQGTITSQPYVQPSFWAKLGSIGKGEVMANAQAESMLGGAEQAEKARMLIPTYANSQNQATAYAATGAPQQVGGLQGQTDITTANTMLNTAKAQANRNPVLQASIDADTVNKLHQATNVDPMVIQHNINQLRGELGRDPTEQEILNTTLNTRQIQSKAENAAAPFNAQSLVGQSQLQASRTLQDQQLLPYEQAIRNVGAVNSLYEAEHPAITQPSVFTGYTDPSDMTITPGRLSPQQSMMGQLTSNMGTNNMGGAPTTVSIGGNTVPIPPEPNGNSSMTGAIDPLMAEHAKNLHKAQGDADEAEIKARKAQIDLEAKQQKLKHLAGTPLPHGTGNIVGNTLVGTAKDILSPFVNSADYTFVRPFRLLGQSISGENQ